MPFKTLAYHRVQGVKTDDKNKFAVILGLNHESTGYRALRVSDDPGGSVSVFQDIKALPGQGTARHLIDKVTLVWLRPGLRSLRSTASKGILCSARMG